MMSARDAARAANRAGLVVVPPRQDGTKAPALTTWQQYQTRRPTNAELKQWFPETATGIGIICGAISGGLELLEIEGRAVTGGYMDRLNDLIETAGLGPLFEKVTAGYFETSPSGGYHILYRVDGPIPGNTKLARRPGPEPNQIEVLAETRGEGGYVIVAPSSGPTHPSGQPWTLISGGFDQIATISNAERDELHAVVRLLDEMPTASPPTTTYPQLGATNAADGKDRPGDKLNARGLHGFRQLLTTHGWEFVSDRGGIDYYRRPGKQIGISATVAIPGSAGRTGPHPTLKVFSSSTPFDTERTYDLLGTLAVLEHGGDLIAAVTALADTTTRQPWEKPQPPHSDQDGHTDTQNGDGTEDAANPYTARLQANLHTVEELRELPPPIPLIDGVLDLDTLAIIHGAPKTMKSFIALSLALSVSTGTWWQGLKVAKHPVLYVAGEGQSTMVDRIDAWLTHENLINVGELHILTIPVNLFNAAHVAAFTTLVNDLGFRFILFDTLARCTVGADENSAKDMGIVIDHLDHIRRHTAACILGVHHDNRAGSNMRGSSALDGAVDIALSVTKEDQRVEMTVALAKNHADGTRWRFLPTPTGRSVALGQYRGDIDGLITENVLKMLEALEKFSVETGASASEWRVATGIPERSFYRLKDGLIDRKLVGSKGTEKRPRYAITATGTATLNDHRETL